MCSWKPALLEISPFDREFDRDIEVESRTGGGRYIVNLFSYTCTCPDFTGRRAERPVGDIGRSCKHLRDTVLSLDSDAFGDELTRVIFKSPHGPYDKIWFSPDSRGDIVALCLRSDKPWMNIFVRDGIGQPYTRYGFHPAEKRWAYESSPSQAGELLEMLEKVPGLNQ